MINIITKLLNMLKGTKYYKNTENRIRKIRSAGGGGSNFEL